MCQIRCLLAIDTPSPPKPIVEAYHIAFPGSTGIEGGPELRYKFVFLFRDALLSHYDLTIVFQLSVDCCNNILSAFISIPA